jgi:site-specific recombinase XerD
MGIPEFRPWNFGLDAGVDIIKVKELLGHRHVTTTQIYDKRRRSLKEGASHDVPI